jgi:hypothetical protein
MTAQRQQVGVTVHQDGFESTLKEVSHEPVAPIEGLGVNAIQVTHQPRQICLPRMQHQVVMVAHLAIGEQLRVEPVYRMGDGVKLRLPIKVVPIDRFAPVAARRDVIDRVGEFDAQGTGHEGDASRRVGERRDLTPIPQHPDA